MTSAYSLHNVGHRAKVFELDLIGIAISTPDKQWLEINHYFCQLLGYSEAELRQKSWPEITHPDDLAKDLDQFERLLQRQINHYTLTKRYLRKDGSAIHCQLSVGASFNANNQVKYFVAIVQDISAQVALERQLHQATERLELALRASNDGLIDWDLGQQTVFFDENVYAMAGYQPYEYPCQLTELRSRVHPQHQGRVDKMLDALRLGRQHHLQVEFRLRRRDGNYMWVLARGAVVTEDAQGKALRVLATLTDINDRMQLQQRLLQVETEQARTQQHQEDLKNLIYAMPDVVCLRAPDGTILACNPKFEALLGRSESELIGRCLYQIIPPHSAAKIRDHDQMVLKTGQSARFEDDVVFVTDGHKASIETIKTLVRDKSGRLIGLLAVSRDITQRRQTEAQNQAQADFLRLLVDHIPNQIFWKDKELNYLGCNQTFAEQTGLDSPEQVKGLSDYDLPTNRDYADSYRAWDQRVLASGKAELAIEEEYRRANGERGTMLTSKLPIRDQQQQVIGLLGIGVDITERNRVEAEQRLTAAVFENSAEAMVITDPKFKIVRINRSFSTITGFSSAETKDQPLTRFNRHSSAQELVRRIGAALRNQGHWHGELTALRKDGSEFPAILTISEVRDSMQRVRQYVLVFTDITEQKSTEKKLAELAHCDNLTGLPNRRMLKQRLEQSVRSAARNQSQTALIFIDVDYFKNINDSYGHEVGDHVLIELSQRLSTPLRADDTLARIGGDEFVVLLDPIQHPEQPAIVASKLMEALTDPYVLPDGQEHRLSASMGIALYPRDGEDPSTLLRNADTAMYRAKESGRNNYAFYTESLTQHALDQVQLRNALHQAIEQDQLSLYYQPQFDLASGKLIGVEALLRWHHPERGAISPGYFIPIAEQTGMITSLGLWVLNRACSDGARWHKAGYDFGTLAVNIAGAQIQRAIFVDEVKNVIKATGMPADKLELEVTENFIMKDPQATIKDMNTLRELGIALAIDDFGTGYSSLNYLKQLPINKLKIDQSFVRDIPQDPNDMAIAEAVIALGKALKLRVLAEGVETQAQAQFLLNHDCSEVQGFLFGHPQAVDEIEALLRKQHQ